MVGRAVAAGQEGQEVEDAQPQAHGAQIPLALRGFCFVSQ